MSKVFDKLPETVFAEGKEYKINTDFKVWAEIADCFDDNNISDSEKICMLLKEGYAERLPPHLDTAVEALLDFMSMNKFRIKGSNDCVRECVLSFKTDEGLIYASFLQQYRIDLYKENLHWWSFLNLLNALDENTAVMKVIGYRSIDCEHIKDKKVKSFYRKMKRKYRLNRYMGENEVAQAIDSLMKQKGGQSGV